MRLDLVIQNTEEDLEFNKFLNSGLGYYKCNRCKHKWKATLGEMMCNPECPRCGK